MQNCVDRIATVLMDAFMLIMTRANRQTDVVIIFKEI